MPPKLTREKAERIRNPAKRAAALRAIPDTRKDKARVAKLARTNGKLRKLKTGAQKRDALGLSAQEKRFLDAFMVFPNASRAAVEAGYSPKYASQTAHAILHSPHVWAEYCRRRQRVETQADRKSTVSRRRTLNRLQGIIDDPNSTPHEICNASRALAMLMHWSSPEGGAVTPQGLPEGTTAEMAFVRADNLREVADAARQRAGQQ